MLPVSPSACLTLSSHAKKSFFLQKLHSVLETWEILRKQVITDKTFENKAPLCLHTVSAAPATLLYQLSKASPRQPSANCERKCLPSPPQDGHHPPHLHKMAATSPAPVPPHPSCPTWATSPGPGGSRGRWPEACRLPGYHGASHLPSLGLHPRCGIAADGTTHQGLQVCGCQLPPPKGPSR